MWKVLRKISLTQWILVSMTLGILLGWLAPDTAVAMKPLSTVFLRMIKSLIVPLIFSTLVIGVAGHGDDLKQVGRLALRSIIYFEIVTTVALVVGLLAVNLARPGVGIVLGAPADAARALAGSHATFSTLLEHIVPQSFAEAAAGNEVLQVVFFAILFAAALTRVRPDLRQVMLHFLESLAEVMFKFTGLVMLFAPIGIGAAIATTVGHSGLGVLLNLGKLILTLYAALILFALLALLPVARIARVPLRRFISAVKEPWLIAFSTASSEAALPLAFENMEAMGVPRRIVAFVLPTGYTFNLDGTTLYLAVASIFVAQAAGVHLSPAQQVFMMLTLMLTSKGVAGVPRAALVILSGTVASFGLPLEGVAILLGVDAVLDMGRTSLNLVGNCLATAVMARWEGEFERIDALAAFERKPALAGVEQEG
jgi:proton glutamate symport protein